MKKNVILVIVCFGVFLNLKAQDTVIYKPQFYFGTSTGINNINGTSGGNFAYRITDKVLLRGGIGIGMYGVKGTLGLKLEQKNSGYYRYIGYSYFPGKNNLQQELELKNEKMQTVNYNYLPATTINFALGHQWKISRKNLLVFELGYAIAIDKQRWVITDGSNLSSLSKDLLNAYQPGGLIIGFGILFGI